MSERAFLDGRVELHAGSCLDVLPTLAENSIDSCVCDPPYHLTSIIKRFAKTGGADRKPPKKHHQYRRLSTGFMGKKWDGGDVAFRAETWAEVLRVLKPGAYLIAFSGTRTYHRMVTAIEDAGFDIRDRVLDLVASDAAVRRFVETLSIAQLEAFFRCIEESRFGGELDWIFGSGFPKSKDLGNGIGTALKPAHEPICLARKPLIGTNAENIAEFGTGGLNIDVCRIEANAEDVAAAAVPERSNLKMFVGDGEGRAETRFDMSKGRWPANLIHDGSDEVLAAFPESDGQQGDLSGQSRDRLSQGIYGDMKAARDFAARNDSGSAARFFYTAKADAEDRIGSKHPTVKPLDLMQYLVRLVTPKGGLVLDCFAGTGTTGEAAWREGMRAVLIEAEPEYQADIARRMELAQNPTKRAAVAKSKNNLQGAEGTPLFAESPA